MLVRGADGVFFASQTANEGYLTRAEYQEFAKKYDLVVLDAAKGRSWFNILHLHGEKVMFDEVLDYPVQALNHHDREAGPSLAVKKENNEMPGRRNRAQYDARPRHPGGRRHSSPGRMEAG